MERRIKAWFAAALAFAALAGLGAQELARSAKAPAADGILGAGEYAYVGEHNGLRLGLSLSADGATLHAGIEAPGAGWVAVGLGTKVMNGAYMILAAEDKGQAVISEELGKGWSHAPSGIRKLLAQAVRESGERTTLEFSVPVREFVKDGRLELILAFNRGSDSLRAKHTGRAQVGFAIKR